MEDKKVHELIKSVLEAENMSDGSVTIQNANVEIADGLMSEILRVTITQPPRTLNLIIKVAPTHDPVLYKIVQLLYASEIHFYETVLPLFNQLQLKCTGKPFTLVPRFFKAVAAVRNESIIIEDVAPQGYTMLDRKYVFTESCLKTVLQEFGKYHALSFALQKEAPEVWATLDNGVDQAAVFTGEVIDWFCDALKKAHELFLPIKPSISAKLKYMYEHFEPEMKAILMPSAKYPSVIVHMDPWCNNFLFKRAEDSEVIEDVRLIDFQSATKASPVLDISCLLYANASAEAISNWKEMLRVYYESLKAHAAALNCRVEEVYSWEMFMDDWHDYARYGILKSVMGISLNTQEDEDVKPHDRNNVGASFIVDKWNMKTNERIMTILLHADEVDVLPHPN